MLPAGERHLREGDDRNPTIWTRKSFPSVSGIPRLQDHTASLARSALGLGRWQAQARGRCGPERCGVRGTGYRVQGCCAARGAGARALRSLNHHGQLTGFPQPTPRGPPTPQEPPTRLSFVSWREALCPTVHTLVPPPPSCRHPFPPVTNSSHWAAIESGLQELISAPCPRSHPSFEVPRDSKNQTANGQRKLCSPSLHFLSWPAPPITPPRLCRSC